MSDPASSRSIDAVLGRACNDASSSVFSTMAQINLKAWLFRYPGPGGWTFAQVPEKFIWHHHDTEDELFFVIAGRLRMDFRDREVWVGAGEMIVVPHGVEHRPYAEEEVSLLVLAQIRLALVSDLHGNAFALEQVFSRIASHGVDQIICLGDVATLGPEPGWCGWPRLQAAA